MGPVTEADAALWCSLSRLPTPLRSVCERSCALGGVAGAVFEPYGSWWAAGPPTRLGASWWLADPRIRGNAGNFLRGLVGRGRVLAKVWLAVGSSIRLKMISKLSDLMVTNDCFTYEDDQGWSLYHLGRASNDRPIKLYIARDRTFRSSSHKLISSANLKNHNLFFK